MKKNYVTKMLLLLMISLFALTITSFKSFEKDSLDKRATFVNAKNQPPVFMITPQSLVIPACTSQSVTFQCSLMNGVQGNYRYFWTVSGGWNLASGDYPTFTNYITLTSIALNPSTLSVSVRVVDMNTSLTYYGGIGIVGKQSFSSNAFISGSGTSVCSGGSETFNLNGLKIGETVAWSLSNSSQASITNSSATQATVLYNGSGSSGDLIATITNACGQSVQKLFSLHAGPPSFNEFICFSIENYDFCSGIVSVPYTYLPSLNTKDKINASFTGMTSAERTNNANWEWERLSTNITLSKTLNVARIGMVNFGQTGVRVRAKNACGWSEWQQLDFEIVEEPEVMSKNSVANGYEVYPNPTNALINIKPKGDEGFVVKNKEGVLAEIYDSQGMLRKKFLVSDKNGITVDCNGLKKGIYLLKINTKDKIENHRIVID